MSVCGRCLPFRLNRRTICASCGHSLLGFARCVAERLHLLLLLLVTISRNVFERYTSVTPVVVSDFVQASLLDKKCGTGRKKAPLMQKSDDLTPFAHPGFEPVISGLSRPFAFNTKTFGKRVPQSPFQDGIFITRSPPVGRATGQPLRAQGRPSPPSGAKSSSGMVSILTGLDS